MIVHRQSKRILEDQENLSGQNRGLVPRKVPTAIEASPFNGPIAGVLSELAAFFDFGALSHD